MVVQVQIAVGDHRPAPVPPATAHDVHAGHGKGVCRAYHRADVEVVPEVLDRHVQPVAAGVQVGDDRLDAPVAVVVGHVAPVPLGEQLRVQPRVVGPGLRATGPRTDTDDGALPHLGGVTWPGRCGVVVAAHPSRRGSKPPRWPPKDGPPSASTEPVRGSPWKLTVGTARTAGSLASKYSARRKEKIEAMMLGGKVSTRVLSSRTLAL